MASAKARFSQQVYFYSEHDFNYIITVSHLRTVRQLDEETHPRIYFNNLGNFQSRLMLYANYKLAHVFKHVCLWEGEHGPAKSFYSILWPLKGILNSFKDIIIIQINSIS